MSSIPCPHPHPRTPQNRALPAGLAAAVAAILLTTACAAPGMKLSSHAGRGPRTSEVEGLKVTLRRLDPAVLQAVKARPTAPPLAELITEAPKPYTIGPQDVLLVTVWDHPEITLPLGQYRTDSAGGNVVGDDGTMYFPYVGKLKVKGLTTDQARAALTAELNKFLLNPQVDLKVLAYRSQKVFVSGEVKVPDTYNITDVPFTLAEAVHRAGGFTPSADDSRIVLTRGTRSWRLDFQDLLGRGNQAGEVYLHDGDALMVPGAQENPVYMLGELQKPGTLPLIHGNLSLAKALADAGGILGTSADARSIYVIRQGDALNAVDVYHLDARNPATMVLADRFALNPRDIVYVDTGTAVRFNRVMNLLLPTVSAVTASAVGAYEIRYFKK